VRRALGASKLEVFKQLLVEAAVVGVAGGVLGLGLAFLGLWLVRHQPADYASLAHLDLFMLGVTFALAVGSSMAAGLLPAWRACQITPALQLKSQ
jgi:putative ABC transport system permease protein